MARTEPGSLQALRQLNRRRVVEVLIELGSASQADIARRTRLSRSTVSSVVADLRSAGLVVERDDQPGGVPRGGRPPVRIALVPSAGAVIGVDLGHSHIRVVAADLAHVIVAEDYIELDVDGLPAGLGIDQAAAMADVVLQRAGLTRSDVVGVGMGLPGPVDRATGTVGSATLLPGWVGVRAAEELSARLGLPVHLDNDANLAALAEVSWGAGAGCDHVAYIKVAHGIGCGLVIGGQVHRGATGTAGEIGHTTFDENGPVCPCGNRGCLEVVAAGPALLRLLQRSHDAPTTVADMIRRARAGDAACQRVIADAGRQIGVALANLCNLFNPERLVIGGELAAADELLLDPIRVSLRRGAIQSAAATAQVVPAALGERAAVLGAVALVLFEADDHLTSSLLAPAGAGL